MEEREIERSKTARSKNWNPKCTIIHSFHLLTQTAKRKDFPYRWKRKNRSPLKDYFMEKGERAIERKERQRNREAENGGERDREIKNCTL